MSRHRVAVAVLLAALTLQLVGAAPSGRSCDRDCRIGAANAYLAALVSHDGADVPLHPEAWRHENGGAVLEGGEAIREALASPIMYLITGMRELRWYADGDNVVAYYLLDTLTSPSFIAERFLVDEDGLIREIDAHFYIDISGYLNGPESLVRNPVGQADRFSASDHGPLGPIPVQDGGVGDDAPHEQSSCGPACVESAVDALLGGMVAHDAAGVPLHRQVEVSANRRLTRVLPHDVAGWLESDNGISDLTTVITMLDGDQAVVFFDAEVAGTVMYTALQLELVDGQIRRIAILCDSSEACTT